MPVKRTTKTFEELKKELEKEVETDEALVDKLYSIVSNILKSYIGTTVGHKHEIQIDPDNNFILTIEYSGRSINIEDIEEIDYIMTRIFSLKPEDKVSRIGKNKAIVVYRIARQILVEKRERDIENELSAISFNLAISAIKKYTRGGEVFRKLMEERKNES
jgi:hypothetical protein